MANEMKFKRYEVKYRISRDRYMKIIDEIAEHMIPDSHGRSTIFSLYFDTSDYRLIRRSMEHPDYKEKLRLRSYGAVGKTEPVFLELKKKYDSVVYKRRIEMTEQEAFDFCREASGEQYASLDHQGQQLSYSDIQIRKEISYALQFYPNLRPRMLLSYEREAWYEKGNHDFRITFDQNLLWRETELNLHTGAFGKHIIPEDEMIMEVKTGMGMPLWLTQILTREKIYKTSFSKYATAYRQKAVEEMVETAFEATVEQLLKGYAQPEKQQLPERYAQPEKQQLLAEVSASARRERKQKRRHIIGGRKYA